MIVLVHDHPKVKLLAAPFSLPGESVSSWIQQVCGAHQYSMKQLARICGIRPTCWDWDVGVAATDWPKLVKLTDYSGICGEALFSFALLRGQALDRNRFLVDGHKPRSRWCSICLAADTVPYLRWEWRLAGVERCAIHDVVLEDRCGWCGGWLYLHRALLVGGGSAPAVPDLSTCGHCGMSLVDSGTKADEAYADSSYELVNELLRALKQAYHSTPRQLTFDFERYRRVIEPSDPIPPRPVWLDLQINRLPDPSKATVRMCREHFHGGVTPEPLARKARWSARLRPADRLLLARALRVIRLEKKFTGDELEIAGRTRELVVSWKKSDWL